MRRAWCVVASAPRHVSVTQLKCVGVSFPGGTNLLHALVNESRGRLGHEIRFSGCRFRATDVPAGLEVVQWGITPLIEGGPRGAEG